MRFKCPALIWSHDWCLYAYCIAGGSWMKASSAQHEAEKLMACEYVSEAGLKARNVKGEGILIYQG